MKEERREEERGGVAVNSLFLQYRKRERDWTLSQAEWERVNLLITRHVPV
jgi:hypothetical protein